MNRRHFLKMATIASTGLLMGFSLTENKSHVLSKDNLSSALALDALIAISPDNKVFITLNRVEMGQGIDTGIPMLIAEDMEADWELVEVIQADANEDKYGNQTTTASISIYSAWSFAREASAKVKQLLLMAAAELWQVNISQCNASKGYVCGPNNKASFGELAALAVKQKTQTPIKLKESAEFTLIGRSVARLQLKEIVCGETTFGVDVSLPRQRIATIIKPPERQAKVIRYKAPPLPHGVDIVEIPNGIAVVGRNYWQAQQIANNIDVSWDISGHESLSSDNLMQHYEHKLQNATVAVTENSTSAAKRSPDAKVVKSRFKVPYMAHATMEPVNATAEVFGDRCIIIAPTQAPDKVKKDVSERLGLSPEQVEVKVTRLGGGFGRKSYRDFIIDAVDIAQKVNAPVKLIYSRENDIKHGVVRPATVHETSAQISPSGTIEKFDVKAAGPSILQFYSLPKVKKEYKDFDYLTFAGLDTSPYTMSHFRASAFTDDNIKAPPVGILRSIGHSASCFVREVFIDQIAKVSKKDPLNYRLELLKNNDRARATLMKAATIAQWDKKTSNSRYLGCAVFEESHPKLSYYVCNAQIAEISIVGGQIKVHRIVTVGDFGQIVHPDLVKNQMEGGVVFGMSLTMFDKITVANGQIQQSNFHDYRLPRMSDTPVIDTYIIKSSNPPSGVGEKTVPATIPAICNAYFAATNQLVTELPIS